MFLSTKDGVSFSFSFSSPPLLKIIAPPTVHQGVALTLIVLQLKYRHHLALIAASGRASPISQGGLAGAPGWTAGTSKDYGSYCGAQVPSAYSRMLSITVGPTTPRCKEREI